MLDDWFRDLFSPDPMPQSFGERFGSNLVDGLMPGTTPGMMPGMMPGMGIGAAPQGGPPIGPPDAGPSSFADRFIGGGPAPGGANPLAGLMEKLTGGGPKPVPTQSFTPPMPGGGAPPLGGGAPPGMPTPQPDLSARLSGAPAMPPGALPFSGEQPPGAAGGPPNVADLLKKLMGGAPGGGGYSGYGMPPPPSGTPPGAMPPGAPGGGDAMLPPGAGPTEGRAPPGVPGGGGFMDRLSGMVNDPKFRRNFGASIAGGMAGGNPAFKGGAFMKGLSGGLSGGQKADKQFLDEEVAKQERTQKQSNWESEQADKKLSNEALNKLRGAQAGAYEKGTIGAGGRGAAWNKPPMQNVLDLQRAIKDVEARKNGIINLPRDQRAEAAKKIDAELAPLRQLLKENYKQLGMDENGNPVQPQGGGGPQPNAPATGRPTTQAPAPTYDRDTSIGNAREAIARGADPDMVKQRLKESNIPFDDSDLKLD